MWMNVLKALITVILLQLAMTFKGAIVALANLDTREMDFLAQVSTCVFLAILFLKLCARGYYWLPVHLHKSVLKTVCIEGGLPCGQRF